jgi:hypothetical protein
MNNMELAGAVVTAPSTAFSALKEQPRFWFPLLAVCLSTAVVLFWYYSTVDIEWLKDRLLNANANNAELTEQQRARASKFISGTFLTWSSVAGAIVVTLIVRALEAVYFSLAGNIANVRYKFQQWFALSCWTALPHLITTAAMAVYLLTAGSNQLGYEELSVLSLNELFFNKSITDKGFALLSGLTVLHPWAWWLTVVGVRAWSGRSWWFSSVFALVPIVLVYGGWALWSF